MTRCALIRAVIIGTLAFPAVAVSIAAAQAATLDRVDSLIADARYDEARAALQTWWSARDNANAPGAERARALMSRARLTADPAAAEEDFLAIVFGYPHSPQAPEALLRLGQGLLATGDPTRAAGYLQRLVADYPGRPERTLGLLWSARANLAARQLRAACTAARDGLADTRDPDLLAMLRIEEAAACTGATSVAARPTPPPDGADRPPAAAAVGTFSVQLGAFRQQEGVDELVARLRRAGHQPRVVLVPDNTLMRVRVGRFVAAADAVRLHDRIRSEGFDAVVVSDADRERDP